MLRYVIVLELAVMAVAIFCASVIRAAAIDKMTTVEAVSACRTELSKNAKYMDVRACVIRKKQGK